MSANIIAKVPIVRNGLTSLLNTFDDDTAVFYNQEKRRIFKTEVFGQIVLELPDDEELTEMKSKCNFAEPFKATA